MPPVAAMRDDVAMPESTLHRRIWIGSVLFVIGLGNTYLGAFTSINDSAYWVGGGVFALVMAAILTSPVIGRPVIRLLGAVYRRLFGAVGLMAEQNATRNPRRTAATASALMIGLTLVSMMSVFGASAKASVDKSINENFAADYVVSNAIGQPFSTTVTKDVAAVPGVATVSPMRYLRCRSTGTAASPPRWTRWPSARPCRSTSRAVRWPTCGPGRCWSRRTAPRSRN